jgi:hypothetical protein
MPRAYGAALPDWVFDEFAAVPGALPTARSRMALVHRLAARNPREGSGGPFAALVVDSASGELVSAGVNLVLSSGLSAAHAEVVSDVLRDESLKVFADYGRMAAERDLTVYNARGGAPPPRPPEGPEVRRQ